MEDIFKGIESIIDDLGLNLDKLKPYLNQSTASKLSSKFINAISTDNSFVPQFNTHISTRTVLINNDELYLELDLLEPEHPRKVIC